MGSRSSNAVRSPAARGRGGAAVSLSRRGTCDRDEGAYAYRRVVQLARKRQSPVNVRARKRGEGVEEAEALGVVGAAVPALFIWPASEIDLTQDAEVFYVLHPRAVDHLHALFERLVGRVRVELGEARRRREEYARLRRRLIC